MRHSKFLMLAMVSTLALGACDDKKDDNAAADQTAVESTASTDATVAPATTAETAAKIDATGAYAFATAPGSTNGAVFVSLQNPQAGDDKLLSATSSVAATVEIHETATDATGTMSMRQIDGVDVPAGQTVDLTPAGKHIMLLGLTQPLTEGSTFDITLTFQNAGAVVVPVTVKTAGVPAADTAPATTDTTTPSSVTETPEGSATETAPATTVPEATPDAATTPDTVAPESTDDTTTQPE